MTTSAKLIAPPTTEGFWDKEEFEELVVRGLVASYETNLYLRPPVKKGYHFHIEPWKVGTKNDLNILRAMGPYFPPDDRDILDSEYWHDIDGVPQAANFAYMRPAEQGDDLDGEKGTSYLEIKIAQRVNKFPKGVVLIPGRYIAKYRLANIYPKPDGIEIYADYFGLKENGTIQLETLRGKLESYQKPYALAALQFYADRRFIWNVQAIEHEAKATFGVNMEQVKSLFYSRELPVTATKRKRPILHWVRAHQRRMQSGTEYDVTKHLRGINEFEMDGTLFRITRPIKQTIKAELR